ncbi:hypothetical protein HNR42_000118 [Deinobacterium chartae]|uniref:Cof-type HAD-IIB family hydrolase n=1 Tax=Deinobacterium chartae TaxID=521158 RepID=A0A841HUW0_9DEIO|nr:Cof-type HAD-IIB family hydrolase [Deinobacterium chartae]MBB6096706.1 hypothetical protein [Deinobacterium chartae]
MIDLICIDVDGTLVGTSGEVLPEVWEAARAARARGQHLALSTGRPAFGKALEYARQLDPQGWHIFQSGASIVNVDSGETLSKPLSSEILTRLVEMSRARHWILEVYNDTDYAVERAERRAVEHADLLGVPFRTRDPLSLEGPIVRAQWVAPIDETATYLASRFEGIEYSPAGSPIMQDTMFISITQAGVDKASAVTALAGRLGIPLERVMMVGDGHNDAQAMRVVGAGVAMGNADAEAKAAARYHVGHVDQGGLIEALELSTRL